MKKSRLLGAVYATLALAALDLHAATVVTGTVGNSGGWGFVRYSHPGGALMIDILAAGWTGGPTGHGIDDTLITWHVDDGSPLTAFTGAFLALNDDAPFPDGRMDGSTSGADSLLNFSDLAAGDYLLAIGHCCLPFLGDSRASSNNLAPYLDYQVTFSAESLTATVSAVPVPAAVWLFGSGLLGLVGISRRKPAS